MAEEKKRTTVRLAPDLHRQLKTAAATKGRTIEDLIHQAVQRELQPLSADAPRRKERSPDDHRELHEILAEVERIAAKLRRCIGSDQEASPEVLSKVVESYAQCLPVPLVVEGVGGLLKWCNVAYQLLVDQDLRELVGKTHVFAESRATSALDGPSMTLMAVSREGFNESWWVHEYTFTTAAEEVITCFLAFSAAECQAAKRSEVVKTIPISVGITSDDASLRGLLRECFEHLPTAAVLKNLDGTYAWHNSHLRKLLPAENLSGNVLGKRASEVFPMRDDAVKKHERRVIVEKVAVLATEVIGKDVERTALRFPIFDAGGEVIFIGAVGVDPRRFKLPALEQTQAKPVELVEDEPGGVSLS